MFVLVEESAETIASTDVDIRDHVGIGDRGGTGCRVGRCCCCDRAVGAVAPLVLAWGVWQAWQTRRRARPAEQLRAGAGSACRGGCHRGREVGSPGHRPTARIPGTITVCDA